LDDCFGIKVKAIAATNASSMPHLKNNALTVHFLAGRQGAHVSGHRHAPIFSTTVSQ
jgi:hypothetical protein